MNRISGRKKNAAILMMLLLLLILAASVLSIRIKTVSVSGNVRYTAEEIEEMLFDSQMSKNSAFFYYRYKFQPHKQIPFVEDYKVVFRSPTNVEIITYEKSVVGYVSYMNSLMYFDKDGIIVESTSEKLPGIPMVTGLKFGHIVLHRPLPIENSRVFEEILNLTQLLSVEGITVDKIHYNSRYEAELAIGGLQVKLGDNTNISGKVSELNDIISGYEDLEGTLFLDTYDSSNANLMFRFQKK